MIVALALASAALAAGPRDWNPRLAAGYLDQRQKDWFAWKPASRTGGPCVSCHTGVPYLIARPALRRALGETDVISYEDGLRSGLRTRTASPPAPGPGAHAIEGIGVEAVLAALFLPGDREHAFDRLWSLQIKEGPAKGAWPWFNLDLDPWETPEAQFYGASLAAMAIGEAPPEYRKRPEAAALIAYFSNSLDSQPLHNRLTLLWASAKWPAILAASKRQAILDETWRRQQPDGGWTAESLGPFATRAAAPESSGSNSYATAVASVALLKAGVPASDPRLANALTWLRSHQDKQSGYWAAESMNKHYEAGSMQILFMRDAATALASLALLEAER